MLKKRIIAQLNYSQGELTRTKQFVPDYGYTINFLEMGAFDEVIIINLDREPTDTKFVDFCEKVMDQAMVPCTIGGGVASVEHATELVRGVGADKVVLSTYAEPDLLDAIAEKLGSQSVVACVDAINFAAIEHKDRVLRANGAGAGEIMLNSILLDGSLRGFDLDAVEWVSDRIDKPLTVAGGCGNWQHIGEAFTAGADGVVTSNIHHLTKRAALSARQWLRDRGYPVRDLPEE